MHGVARTMATNELDEITLRRAARGETAATRALVETYQSRVFALVSRIIRAWRSTRRQAMPTSQTRSVTYSRPCTTEPASISRTTRRILSIAA